MTGEPVSIRENILQLKRCKDSYLMHALDSEYADPARLNSPVFSGIDTGQKAGLSIQFSGDHIDGAESSDNVGDHVTF